MLLLFCLSVWSAAEHSPTQAQRFEGHWYIEEIDETTVHIYRASDGFWYGKIIDSADPDQIGDMLLKEMRYQPQDKVLEGTIIQQFSGISASATLQLNNPHQLEMNISKFFMSKTVLMERLPEGEK